MTKRDRGKDNKMKFKSVNELENFSFDDCQVINFQISEEQIKLEVEALIVKPNNTQNTNFTESYADITEIRLIGAKIISAVKEGYKYFTADDELITEVLDEPLSKQSIRELTQKCSGAYLFSVERQYSDEGFKYLFSIEFSDEEEYNAVSDSYRFEIEFEKSIVEWDRYLNRVQR